MDPRVFAYNFFISRGWTPEQSAGIVGNLAIESYNAKTGTYLDPTVLGDHGQAFGIAQWRGERQKNLMRFAAANNMDYRTRVAQLAFVDHELNTTEKHAGDILRAAKTVPEATGAVVQHYERAGVPHLDRRITAAMGIHGSGPLEIGTAVAPMPTSAGQNLPRGAAPTVMPAETGVGRSFGSAAAKIGGSDGKSSGNFDFAESAGSPGLEGSPLSDLSSAPAPSLKPLPAAQPAIPKSPSPEGPISTGVRMAKNAPLQSGGVKVRKS